MKQLNQIKYQQLQQFLTYGIIAAAVLFVLYLVFAGLGIIWAKVVAAVLAILISFACLALLYLRKELLRQRSLWMTVAAAAIIVCLLFSLILNFPSPNKYKDVGKTNGVEVSAVSVYNGEL